MTVPRFLLIIGLLIGGLYGLSLWLGSNRGEPKQSGGFADWLGRMAPQKKVDLKSLQLQGCTLNGDIVSVPANALSPAGITIAGDKEADTPRMLKITLLGGTVDGWTMVYLPGPPLPDEKVKLKSDKQTIFDKDIIRKLQAEGKPLERGITAGASGGALQITYLGSQTGTFQLR